MRFDFRPAGPAATTFWDWDMQSQTGSGQCMKNDNDQLVSATSQPGHRPIVVIVL